MKKHQTTHIPSKPRSGKVQIIRQASVLACDHAILVPEHYLPDGSCKCTDPYATIMEEWEYTWDAGKGRWV